jgi:hypothetical protein
MKQSFSDVVILTPISLKILMACFLVVNLGNKGIC